MADGHPFGLQDFPVDVLLKVSLALFVLRVQSAGGRETNLNRCANSPPGLFRPVPARPFELG